MRLGDLLGRGGDPDEVLVHHGDRTTTRREIVDAAEGLAGALVDSGLEPGQPVAVRLDDGADVLAALFGVWWAEGVYVPVSPRSTDAEAERVHEQTHPARVLTAGLAFGHTAVPPARHDRDVALVQLTSGTTGDPKPVPLRHSSVLDLMDRVLRRLGVDPEATRAPDDPPAMPNLIPVSLSLWAGIYNVLFALRVGAPVVLAAPFTTASFSAAVARHGIRSTVLPPAAMVMLADDPAVDSLAPLRFVRSITAPLSPEVAVRFHDRFGVTVLNSYGQTELGGEVIGWSAADARQHGTTKLGALGRPHGGVDVRVADDGELLVRTPHMNLDPAEAAERLTGDGFLRTGDLGYLDDDGFVWISGRVSDVINRGGLKVQPADVETVLATVEGVREVAVTGVPDERLGEVPVAYVVPVNPAAPPAAAALEAAARAELAAYKVPVRFVAVAALPRTEVGKVQRRALPDLPGTTL